MSEIQTISIVGDGQLGMMITEAALPMGYEVNVIGPAGPNSPAVQAGAKQLEGGIKDADAIKRLAEAGDILTIEVEHVNAEAMANEMSLGRDVQPSPYTIITIKDKLHQKEHYIKAGLPVGPFRGIENARDLAAIKQSFGQVIMKARTEGFDGRGNLMLPEDMSWQSIVQHFTDKDGNRPDLYAEKVIPFQRELAVVGARDRAGNIGLYPVVQTVHKDSICDIVIAPAEIDPRVQRAAEELGRAVIESFEGAGVFAVELFQHEADQLLINETAPRVHNSGHWTIEGAETSQFEQHIRAITGQELGSTEMTVASAVMKNVLGTRTSDTGTEAIAEVKASIMRVASSSIFPHAYGKSLRPARKVGHITAVGSDPQLTLESALQARQLIAA